MISGSQRTSFRRWEFLNRISGDNLRREGVPEEKIKFVGNIMIDTLEANREKAQALTIPDVIARNRIADTGKLPDIDFSEPFAVVTLHRHSNVDNRDIIRPLLQFLMDEVCPVMPVIWPVHPRTMKQLTLFSLWGKAETTKNMMLLHPLGYHDMLRLNMGAKIMLTDSGGLQEECCILGTPCLTVRWNTERPVTLREHGGTSVLVGNNVDELNRNSKKRWQTKLSLPGLNYGMVIPLKELSLYFRMSFTNSILYFPQGFPISLYNMAEWKQNTAINRF